MSNLLKRIERIENALGEQPYPGQLSPELQEAVDRLLKRVGWQCDELKKDPKGEDDATGK